MARAHDGKLFTTRNDLDEETRVTVVRTLNQSLADTTDLATQVKHAHWNVKGEEFQQLHLLFDDQAELLAEHADSIAERATALGGHAMGTARMAAEHSRIDEMSDAVTCEEYLEALADRFAAHAENLREDVETTLDAGDVGTSDMYTEILRETDKQLWFLESHLQGPELVERTGVTVATDD